MNYLTEMRVLSGQESPYPSLLDVREISMLEAEPEAGASDKPPEDVWHRILKVLKGAGVDNIKSSWKRAKNGWNLRLAVDTDKFTDGGPVARGSDFDPRGRNAFDLPQNVSRAFRQLYLTFAGSTGQTALGKDVAPIKTIAVAATTTDGDVAEFAILGDR